MIQDYGGMTSLAKSLWDKYLRMNPPKKMVPNKWGGLTPVDTNAPGTPARSSPLPPMPDEEGTPEAPESRIAAIEPDAPPVAPSALGGRPSAPVAPSAPPAAPAAGTPDPYAEDPNTMKQVLAGSMGLAGYGDDQGAWDQQLAVADQLRNTPEPEGRHAGRVFVAANPLEFIGAGIKQYKGNKERGTENEDGTDGTGLLGKMARSRTARKKDLARIMAAIGGQEDKFPPPSN